MNSSEELCSRVLFYQEREKKLKSQREQEEKKKKNAESFQAWLKNAEKRINTGKIASSIHITSSLVKFYFKQ